MDTVCSFFGVRRSARGNDDSATPSNEFMEPYLHSDMYLLYLNGINLSVFIRVQLEINNFAGDITDMYETRVHIYIVYKPTICTNLFMNRLYICTYSVIPKYT